MGHLGNAAMELLTDRTKLVTTVGGFTALFLGLYGARESTRVVGRSIEMWLGTPKLVGAGEGEGKGRSIEMWLGTPKLVGAGEGEGNRDVAGDT